MPRSIGAALIVKNEQRCLARCLDSIRPIVDEIVVVDTGSSDDSVAIALECGARVLHQEWTGDFSQARNLGLDALRADLVLYIDADEWLAPGSASRASLDEAMAVQPDAAIYRVLLRPRPGFTPYRECRLWTHRPEVRFRGVVHESVVPDLNAIMAAEGRGMGEVDLLLEHDGYEGDQAHKRSRYLPLLGAQLVDDPDRTYLWDHVGRIRAENGEGEGAREAYDRGIEVVRRRGVREPSDCLVFADRITGNALSEVPDADLVAEAVGYFPTNPLIRWSAALDALARGRYAEVEEHIAHIVDADFDEVARTTLSMNERILTERVWHVRAMARFETGDWAGAAADLRRAEQAAPDVVAYRAKRVVAEARAAADQRVCATAGGSLG